MVVLILPVDKLIPVGLLPTLKFLKIFPDITKLSTYCVKTPKFPTDSRSVSLPNIF